MGMTGIFLRVTALLVTALSLAPSFAHVLEAPPRLLRWSPALWREATVFNGQYQLFGTVGAAIDGAAVLVTATMAFVMRTNTDAFGLAVAGAACYALALIAWVAIVAPANAVLATWLPGPIPMDFESIRNRWEIGHMVVAGLKVIGFIAVASATSRS
jgi:hypothetical protein